MSKEHVCDGDKACDDNSDEKDCKCITTKFLCPTGECLDVEDLCDEANDCDDKTDESRCGNYISRGRCNSGLFYLYFLSL